MKKFIACGNYSFLGNIYDTAEQAKRAARGIDYYLDSKTGYSTAFNKEVEISSSVTEVEDRVVTVEEYLSIKKQFEEEKIIFEKMIKQMRREFYAKYNNITLAYVNLNTPYHYNDTIRIITRRSSGRKRTIEGKVYGVYITDDGSIRPSIINKSYPVDEPIISIEIIERFEPIEVRQQIVCKNCKFFTRNESIEIAGELYTSRIGFCSIHQKEVGEYYENQYNCYINDPGTDK